MRRTSETGSGSALPTPVKYDAYGTWESNNYHGLGWLGKHGWKATDEELREAGMTAEPDQLGLFPTPRALDHNKRGDFDVDNRRNGLPAAVRKRVTAYPTPTATDGERGSRWTGQGATVTAGGMMVTQGDGRTHQMGLRGVVRIMHPTPMHREGRSDGLDGGSNSRPAYAKRLEQERLPTPTSANGLRNGSKDKLSSVHHPLMWQHPGHPEFGELNPYWVEWLMGWPIGWTSLEPLPMENYLKWWYAQDGGEGRAIWWTTDPSTLDPPHHVGRTCAADLPDRVDRIAALGNGQVSAAMAAAWIHLSTIPDPPETEE